MSVPDLSDPDLKRLMVRLGLPAMAGLSLNAAHQVVDAGFVGQLGAAPLAVLVLLAPFAGLVAALGIGLGIGAASTTARALGAKKPQHARQIAGVAFCATFALAVAVGGLLLIARAPALRMLGVPPSGMPLASSYYTFLSLTVSFGLIQIMCDFLAIGRGAARMSLRTLALCFGLNMMLDPVFIFAFGLGLDGAALATLTAQIITLGVWAVWFRACERRPEAGSVALLVPIIRVGAPEAVSFAVTTFGFIAVLRLAADLGGLEAVAGLGLALRLLFVLILPLEGFAIGVQPILAHAHGEGAHARLVHAQAILVRAALVAGGLAAIVVYFCAAPLAGLLSNSAAVQQNAAMSLGWLMLAVPAIAVRLVGQISLQAAIRPWLALWLGLAPMGWVFWPVLGALVPRYAMVALPLSITLAACLSAILALALLRHARLSHDAMGVSA